MSRNHCFALVVLFLSLIALCAHAKADLIAFDAFSLGNTSGGTGWTNSWNGSPTFGSANPLVNGVSAGWLCPPTTGGLTERKFAPLYPATTPEVWVGVYLRADIWPSWQFGLIAEAADVAQGAQIGDMLGGANALQLARYNAESPSPSLGALTLGQPFFMAVRVYKNDPSDTVYNRADLWADLNGNDGMANDLVLKHAGLDLGTRSAQDIGRIRLMATTAGTGDVKYDYVAVGTTKADVVIPEPSSMMLLTLCLLGLLCYAWRRRK